MLAGLYIIVDEDFDALIYADPDPEDLEPEVWGRLMELVQEAADGEVPPEASRKVGEYLVAWRALHRNGLTFVAIVEDLITDQQAQSYLKNLVRHYFDEVDDVRNPEKDGVADVVVDVIPPWEEGDD